jgi:hypothetical protein
VVSTHIEFFLDVVKRDRVLDKDVVICINFLGWSTHEIRRDNTASWKVMMSNGVKIDQNGVEEKAVTELGHCVTHSLLTAFLMVFHNSNPCSFTDPVLLGFTPAVSMFSSPVTGSDMDMSGSGIPASLRLFARRASMSAAPLDSLSSLLDISLNRVLCIAISGGLEIVILSKAATAPLFWPLRSIDLYGHRNT